jgi:hypothetical protein
VGRTSLVVDASVQHARTDEPKPGAGDLRLNAAMHPRELQVYEHRRAGVAPERRQSGRRSGISYASPS